MMIGSYGAFRFFVETLFVVSSLLGQVEHIVSKYDCQHKEEKSQEEEVDKLQKLEQNQNQEQEQKQNQNQEKEQNQQQHSQKKKKKKPDQEMQDVHIKFLRTTLGALYVLSDSPSAIQRMHELNLEQIVQRFAAVPDLSQDKTLSVLSKQLIDKVKSTGTNSSGIAEGADSRACDERVAHQNQ